jgi:hypothetical protein
MNNKKEKSEKNMKFDKEYALYLLKQFPLSVSKGAVFHWEKKGYIPEKYYTLDDFKIHGIEWNVLLLLTGKTSLDVAKYLGMKQSQLFTQVKNERVSSKNIEKLEEYFKFYKDKKTLTVKLPIIERKHYFLKYSEEQHIYLTEVFICKTKNLGKVFNVELFNKEGLSKKPDDYSDVNYQELLDSPLYEECTRKQAIAKLKIVNRVLAKYITKL